MLETWALEVSKGCKRAESLLCNYLLNRYKSHFCSQGYSIQLVEDATQEALISILDALRNDRLKSHSLVSSYFYTSLKYQLWNSKRNIQRFTPLNHMSEQVNDNEVDELLEGFSNQEKINSVYQSIMRLNRRRDRELLLRRFFEEEGIDSLCEDFEMPKPHFYRVLHRARNRLSALML